MNANGRNVVGKRSGNSSGNDGSPGQLNWTDFDVYGEAHRNGPMGSLWATSKGNDNGSSYAGEYFYPSGQGFTNNHFSLSRAIDFASTITTGDTDSWTVGPRAFAGNMTNAGWVNSHIRREAMWNQLAGIYDFRMMDKTLGVSGSGWGGDISTVWGSFGQSSTSKKRI